MWQRVDFLIDRESVEQSAYTFRRHPHAGHRLDTSEMKRLCSNGRWAERRVNMADPHGTSQASRSGLSYDCARW
jgi:hypothetical protein